MYTQRATTSTTRLHQSTTSASLQSANILPLTTTSTSDSTNETGSAAHDVNTASSSPPSSFQPVDAVYARLTSHNPADVVSELPRGLKTNVSFVVDNRRNVARAANKQRYTFWDDCGAWQSGGPVCRRCFVINDGRLHGVKLVKDKYCSRKVMDKRRQWVPLAVQPPTENIVVLRHLYAHHETSAGYKKRVSWLENDAGVALYEYVGDAPTSLGLHTAISATRPGNTFELTQQCSTVSDLN